VVTLASHVSHPFFLSLLFDFHLLLSGSQPLKLEDKGVCGFRRSITDEIGVKSELFVNLTDLLSAVESKQADLGFQLFSITVKETKILFLPILSLNRDLQILYGSEFSSSVFSLLAVIFSPALVHLCIILVIIPCQPTLSGLLSAAQ